MKFKKTKSSPFRLREVSLFLLTFLQGERNLKALPDEDHGSILWKARQD